MIKINENVQNIREELTSVYKKFFRDLKIDPISGLTEDGRGNKRFATYAYVGSKYGSKKKILFIGLDIGKDEPLNEDTTKIKEDYRYGIQDFEKRRKKIERVTKEGKDSKKEGHNAHISGTMIHAGEILELNPKEESFKEKDYSKGYIKDPRIIKHFEKNNPLSYVALINLRKFVDKEKQGREQGKFVYPEEEKELLYKEVERLNPDLIILQGSNFKNQKETLKELKKTNVRVLCGYHPAYRNKKRTLRNLSNTYEML